MSPVSLNIHAPYAARKTATILRATTITGTRMTPTIIIRSAASAATRRTLKLTNGTRALSLRSRTALSPVSLNTHAPYAARKTAMISRAITITRTRMMPTIIIRSAASAVTKRTLKPTSGTRALSLRSRTALSPVSLNTHAPYAARKTATISRATTITRTHMTPTIIIRSAASAVTKKTLKLISSYGR